MLIEANGGHGMNERKVIEDCLRSRDSERLENTSQRGGTTSIKDIDGKATQIKELRGGPVAGETKERHTP